MNVCIVVLIRNSEERNGPETVINCVNCALKLAFRAH